MPVLVKRLDRIGDDVGLALADGLEQVAVGRQAQPLVPRVVARAEVLLDVDSPRAAAARPWSSASCA